MYQTQIKFVVPNILYDILYNIVIQHATICSLILHFLFEIYRDMLDSTIAYPTISCNIYKSIYEAMNEMQITHDVPSISLHRHATPIRILALHDVSI